MKDLLIVANWKSNKTSIEAGEWLKQLTIDNLQLTNKEIIVCAPFTLLGFLKKEIDQRGLPIKLGAQDVSKFESGPYTGEVSAAQIKEFSQYSIIGHSERRENFHEDDSVLKQKVNMAHESGIIPVYCVLDANMSIPEGIIVVAYEPLSAIGTGNPDTPQDAEEVARKIKENNQKVKYVLYGGSVTPGNVNSFTKMENIDGVLVGGESLDASSFLQIVQNA